MHYISLGYFCSIAMDLEKLGLRTESSPFDWLISDFEGVIRAIRDHFEDFLSPEYLAQNSHCRDHYKNMKYDLQFFHDFDPYQPLQDQLPSVQNKYNRRIQRFYKSITEPTLFIRYINDKPNTDGTSTELLWIEENYDSIMALLKSFHDQNDILFIANDGVTSQKIKIYNVPKDDGDSVARSPLTKTPALQEIFYNIDFPEKQLNIERYQQKQLQKKKARLKTKLFTLLKKIFRKEYIHTQLY